MRFIDRTTDGTTLHLRCLCCGGDTSITEDDFHQPLVHAPTCIHAARIRKQLRDAGIHQRR